MAKYLNSRSHHKGERVLSCLELRTQPSHTALCARGSRRLRAGACRLLAELTWLVLEWSRKGGTPLKPERLEEFAVGVEVGIWCGEQLVAGED